MSTATVETPVTSSPGNSKLQSRGRHWALMFVAPVIVGPLWVQLWAGRPAPQFVTTWTGAVLGLVLGISSYTDFRWRKIPNWVTYPAFLWVLGLSLVTSWRAPVDPEQLARVGQGPWSSLGFGDAFAGAIVSFLIMFGIYRLAGGGAGDVKLAVVIGAVLGIELGVLALVYSYVIAATASMLHLVWTAGPGSFIGAVGRNVASTVLPDVVAQPSPEQQARLKRHIALAPFFTMGTLLVLSGIRWGI